MSRGLPNKLNVASHAFRVPCLTTILDSGSLECENTFINYTTNVFFLRF